MVELTTKRLLDLEKRLKEARIEDIGLELLGDKVRKLPISPDYRGLCPFHVEKHPSFYLKVRWNKYVCFGCGESGGPFDLPFSLLGNEGGLSCVEDKFAFNRNNLLEMAIVKMFVLQGIEKSQDMLYPYQDGRCWSILEEFEPFEREGYGNLRIVYRIAIGEFDTNEPIRASEV